MFGIVMLMIQKFFVLAIGLTFGFWLITKAASEAHWKKILGAIFGWIVIVYTFIVVGMICFQGLEYLRTGELMTPHHMMHGKYQQKMNKSCPCPGMNKPCPMLEKEAKEENEEEEEKEEE